MTERLYWKDQYQTEFKSIVKEKTTRKHEGKNKTALILEASLFYGTSGGQPNDTGKITLVKSNQTVNVIDVLEEKENILVHILDADLPAAAGDEIQGVIDWERRLDHMQQHHGQHILSATFIKIANIPTISFHMSKSVSNIDLDIGNVTLTDDIIQQVQSAANQQIIESHSVSINFYTRDEANKLPLRKKLEPSVEEPIRIIDIQGVDLQACCGTHPRNTSEVQGIVIVGFEKIKKTVRLYFVCGMRMVKYAFQASKTLKSIGQKFGVPPEDAEKAVDQYLEAANASRKQLAEYEKIVFHQNAVDLFAQKIISKKSSHQVVVGSVPGRDVKALKAIAKDDIFAKQTVTAIFSVQEVAGEVKEEESSIMFVLSLSEDVKGIDFREMVKEFYKKYNGKGGGSQGFVQGNVKGAKVADIVAYFKNVLEEL